MRMASGAQSYGGARVLTTVLLVQLLLLLVATDADGSSNRTTWDARSTLDVSPTAQRQPMKLCYLYFGMIGDLGWTFTYNAGRIKTHEALSRLFPNIAFQSVFTQSVASMTYSERHDVIAGYVGGGCHVVLSNNALLMNGEDDAFAASYPNVTFLLLDEYRMENRDYPNRVYVANDVTAAYYVAGAAAGAQARRCIAFLAAWDNETDPTNAWAGFLLGVRRSHATMPVHVISQGSWYYPDSDRILVDAFVRTAGCDVVARYSDPSFVDAAIGNMFNATLFSIGAHADLELYVGDSVLTSVHSDWSVTLLSLLVPMIRNGTWDHNKVHFYGVVDGAVGVSPLSLRKHEGTASAMAVALATVKNHTGDAVVCGVVPLWRGGYVLTNATPNTTCKTPHRNIRDFITGPHVVHHRTFVDPSTCPAGTHYEYAFNTSIELTCRPCASGTVSSQSGASSCTPCPAGSVPDDGGTVCIARSTLHDDLSAGVAASIAVGSFVGAIVVCGACLVAYATRRRNHAAPKKAPLCLVVCAIEASGALERFCSDEMTEAMRTYVSLVQSVVHRNGAYTSVVSSEGGDEGQYCLVACNSAFDAVGLAVEVQELCALTASWPPKIRSLGGLKPRIAVHHCVDVVPYVHVPSMAYRYCGPDAEMARCIAAYAPGGCILADQRTADALMGDDDFGLVLAYEIVVRLWRTCEAADGDGAVGVGRDALLGAVLRPFEDPNTTAATIQPTGNLYSIHSKKLQQWHHKQGDPHPDRSVAPASSASTGGGHQPPPIEGMDPDLNRSVHSSFSTTSSLTLGLRQLDMGPPQIAMALYAVLQAADRYAPGKKRALLTQLAAIFGLKESQLNARRVAAGLAFRVVDPTTPRTGGNCGPTTTARSNLSLPETPLRGPRVSTDDAEGGGFVPDAQSLVAAPLSPPRDVALNVDVPAMSSNPLVVPPTALQRIDPPVPHAHEARRGASGQQGGSAHLEGGLVASDDPLMLPHGSSVPSETHPLSSRSSNGPIVEMLHLPHDVSSSTYNTLQRPRQQLASTTTTTAR